MTGVMKGVKVVELAAWTFVPAAGAVLADWGADVIKIEHPETGDPARGLSIGSLGASVGGVSFIMEQPNRGKRSVALDIAIDAGREVLLKLLRDADVFLTNLLPESIGRLRLTVEDVRAVNPKIIYARGSGSGSQGAEANKGGYDSALYWSRGGIASMVQDQDAAWPPVQRPAFGDIMGGLTLAGGIAGALYKRSVDGEPSVVDVSLLGVAAWNLAPDIVASGLLPEGTELPRFSTDDMPNPITNFYKTADGRYLLLMMLQGARFWPEVCGVLERPDLLVDPRYATETARFENRVDCIKELRREFEQHTLAEWTIRLDKIEGVWAAVQTPLEVLSDPEVLANGYVRPVLAADAETVFRLVASPVQYDETPLDLVRAPQHGEHTDDVLLEVGLDWDEIIELKTASVVY